MTAEPRSAGRRGLELLGWASLALCAWMGSETGSVGAYYGSLASSVPLNELWDTPELRALRVSQEGVSAGALAGAVAAGLAFAVARRHGAWVVPIALLAALAGGALGGWCLGRF